MIAAPGRTDVQVPGAPPTDEAARLVLGMLETIWRGLPRDVQIVLERGTPEELTALANRKLP
jgi:hypothetical protein